MRYLIKHSYAAVLLSVLAVAACEKASLSEKENSGIDLVFTISGDAADTKSIVSSDKEDGTNQLNYSWSESDKMTIIPDVGSAVTATVTPDPSNPKSATIRAKLKDDAKGATSIKVVYPAIEGTKESATIDFSVQDGTLASLPKYAPLCGEQKITISADGAATLAGDISLYVLNGKINGEDHMLFYGNNHPLYVSSSIYGITVKDGKGNPVKVKKAYIFFKDNQLYTNYTVDYTKGGEISSEISSLSVVAKEGNGIEINLKDATTDKFYVAVPGYDNYPRDYYKRQRVTADFFFIDEDYNTYKVTKRFQKQYNPNITYYYISDLVAEEQTGPADLGLSVKWARKNVGERTPMNFDYYTQSEAQSAVESGWRLPTDAEMKELVENCTWIASRDFKKVREHFRKENETNEKCIDGFIVRSKTTGDSIFLIAAGFGSTDPALSKSVKESQCQKCLYWASDDSRFLEAFIMDDHSPSGGKHSYTLMKRTAKNSGNRKMLARAVYIGD